MSNYATEGAISYGWSVMKRDILFYAGITLVTLVVSGYTSWLAEISQDSSPVFYYTMDSAVSVFIQIGMTTIFLNAVREGHSPSISDFCVDVTLYFNFILATLLYGLIVLVGTLLLIVPGIILAIKYGFYPHCMIDQGLGPIEALKMSGEITEGSKWEIFKFDIMLSLVNLLGALAFGIGLLFTMPATLIAYAYVYCNLTSSADPAAVTPDGTNGRRPRTDVQVMSARKR